MFVISLYLTTLIIAPQLWVDAIKDFPVDYVLYPVWFVALLARGKLGKLFEFRTIDWLLLAFILWGLASMLLNPGNTLTNTYIVDYIRFFLVFKLVQATAPTMPELRRVMWVILVFVMIIVVEGIQHKLSPDGLGWAGQRLGWVDPSVLAAGGTGRTRWVNIFDGPGVFCVIYTIGLPIVLVMLGPPFGWLARTLGLVMLGPLLVATYFTGSRGGLLAALAILGLYFLIRLKISVTKIGIVAAAVGAIYMAAPAHMTQIRDENRSAQYRVEMWAQGLNMVKHDPLFGIGRGNYRKYTGRLIAHSSPIELMGETGMMGLFLWVTMLYASIKGLMLMRAGPYDERDKAHATALVLIMIGYIVSALFVTLEYETLYFLVGLCAIVASNLKDPLKLGKWDWAICAGIPVMWFGIVQVFAVSYF